MIELDAWRESRGYGFDGMQITGESISEFASYAVIPWLLGPAFRREDGWEAQPYLSGTASFATSKWCRRAVLPLAISACSSSGTRHSPAEYKARAARSCATVDEPSGDVFEGLVDIAAQQFETETLRSCFFR